METATITGLVFALAIFMAMIMALAIGTKRLLRVSGFILAPAVVCGLFFYTLANLYGASGWQAVLSGIFRGIYNTCIMFMGRNDYSSVARAIPWFEESALAQTLFWLAHLCILFISASAVLSALGGKLLQAIRMYFTSSESVYLIFGLTESSVFLGKDIRRGSRGKIVYISPNPLSEHKEQALSFGAITYQNAYLEDGQLSAKLMRSLRLKHRVKTLCFFALDASESVNIDIAKAAVEWCRNQKIPHKAVRILFRSHGELDYSQLEQFASNDGPVYSVDAFSEAELSARLLVRESPPYKTIEFDADGRALEDFSALIIGFGNVGQHALRQIVMNGQFYGSRFSAAVVDRKADSIAGRFERRYMGMLDAYDIDFHTIDIRSRAFYELLDEISPKLKYVVVSLGSDDANYEATADLERYYTRLGKPGERPIILVNVCNKRFVATTHKNIRFVDRRQLVYTADVLLRSELDTLAEAVNFSYVEKKEETDPHTAWGRLDYFSRESSRASADFIPAMLHIAGIPYESAFDAKLFNEKVPAGSPLMESLSIIEHLRWNAFHYAMGYTIMPIEEMHERAKLNMKHIQKDTVHLRHACLVDWDDLDGVSAAMTDLSGKKTDYKEMDRANVLQIPRTLSYLGVRI